jgi:sulfur transfer protein SufE
MPELRLTHLPTPLHDALRYQARVEGRTIRGLALRILTAYLQEKAAEREEQRKEAQG